MLFLQHVYMYEQNVITQNAQSAFSFGFTHKYTIRSNEVAVLKMRCIIHDTSRKLRPYGIRNEGKN